jgi:transcriptional regulator with XRE-family HTH domain
MYTLKDRLTAALAAKPLGSQADLAKECGISSSAVSFWFGGKTKALRGKNLITAARYLDVEPSWINEGRSLTPVRPSSQLADADQYIRIPFLLATNGDGATASPLAFRRDWLQARGLVAENLRLHLVNGSAMAPTISNRDLVLIDTQQEPLDNDGIWVIGGPSQGLRIKRVLIRENSDLVLRSDNPDKSLFPDEIVVHPLDNLEVNGKVVWRGG